MKKLVTVATLLSVMTFMLTVGALAQSAPGPGTSREPTVTTPREPAPAPTSTLPSMTNEMYASKLIGASVKNPQGENLGKIDELVIDPQDARIKAAVVSVGGVLGIGAKSVAIPWNKVTMGSGADRDTLVVAMGKEELEQAPNWQKTER
ncbi:MAG TPA: PRC-barrel domain-containing protein [Candidatus Tectomicrobia bacterium]|jgi:sporulation protein YlmC with PRC-barrel domain|nr:PRC-barrel domain-containing protein [Candidatus Tectomicrobia bacterium]